MKKKLLFLTALFVLTFCISSLSYAGKWKKDGNGWWYQEDDGSNPKDSWRHINNYWYYFWPNGYLAISTRTPDGFYVNGDGIWIPKLTIESVSDFLYTRQSDEGSAPAYSLEIYKDKNSGMIYAHIFNNDRETYFKGYLLDSAPFGVDGIKLIFKDEGRTDNSITEVLFDGTNQHHTPIVNMAGTSNGKINGYYIYNKKITYD